MHYVTFRKSLGDDFFDDGKSESSPKLKELLSNIFEAKTILDDRIKILKSFTELLKGPLDISTIDEVTFKTPNLVAKDSSISVQSAHTDSPQSL